MAIAGDFDFAPFGEEVHDRDADAVQTAGGLVRPLFEFAAEFEHRHHAFQRGDVAAHFLAELVVLFDGDAAAIVFDGDRAVVIDGDAHLAGKTRHGLVDGIVDDFVHQVVQTTAGAVADVHARAVCARVPDRTSAANLRRCTFRWRRRGPRRFDRFRCFVSHLFIDEL